MYSMLGIVVPPQHLRQQSRCSATGTAVLVGLALPTRGQAYPFFAGHKLLSVAGAVSLLPSARGWLVR